MITHFRDAQAAHNHSLKTLNQLFEYDDFMDSIDTLVDMGCGSGLDLEWWATRNTREDIPKPLNIKCLGVDLLPELAVAKKYKNIMYRNQDFELPMSWSSNAKLYDVLWCHNSFQYVVDPIGTLKRWREMVSDGGMMVLILPQTTNIEYNIQAFDQHDYCYYNWTMVSLIHMLAITGWDCRTGFFKKNPDDPWLHAIVYKSEVDLLDPRTTKWYDLCEKNLLPDSAVASINKYGHLRQRDLILHWLDKSLYGMFNH